MEFKFLALFVILVFAVVILGCIGGEKQTKSINQTNLISNESAKTADTTKRTVYLCPLDSSKTSYKCETDNDCKLVTCRSGAGDIDTCMNVNSEYDGVHSNMCVCKVTGTINIFENGTEKTVEIKNCKHI